MIQQTTPCDNRPHADADSSTTCPNNFALDYEDLEISPPANGLKQKPSRA